MPRLVSLFLLCVTLAGSAQADPIVGTQHWNLDVLGTYTTRNGPTIFGNLPEPGRIIEEVATRTELYTASTFPWIITIETPEYADEPAPMSDVFFSVNLAEIYHSPWVESYFLITYAGGNTLEVPFVSSEVGWLALVIEAVAIRTVDPQADIEDPPVSIDPSMLQRTPNPFRFSTRLEYRIDPELSAEPVKIQVLDSTGRALRTLLKGYQSSGTHVITWDGRDDSGGPVANGVYFIQLNNGPNRRQRRVTMVR